MPPAHLRSLPMAEPSATGPTPSSIVEDALTGDVVILAPARAARPDDFRRRVAPPPEAPAAAPCPFCPGHEHLTPPEIARTGSAAPDAPGWQVRVVPNKFPIVGPGPTGAHEVVVLSPDHTADLGRLAPHAAVAAIRMLRDRSAALLDAGYAHVAAFVNQGVTSGASLAHPHGQVIALDRVPPRAATRIRRFRAAAFVRDRADVVLTQGTAVVWSPPAAASPFALRCAAPGSGARFDRIDDGTAADVAGALARTARALDAALGAPGYNIVLEQAPPDHAGPFEWWADIVPRISVTGGFEIGAGLCVNIVAPATAAAVLREAT